MKRILSLLLCAVMLFAVIPLTVSAAETGVTFTAANMLRTNDIIAAPITFEARLRVSASAAATRLGTIVGNYKEESPSSVGIEIKENGHPALWWSHGVAAEDRRITFTSYDLRNGEIVDLAIVADIANDKALLYINGELIQTISVDLYEIPSLPQVMCLGGDLRSSNSQYLKSTELFSVALFSDVRTAAEIKQDRSAMPTSDSALLGAYDLTADKETRLKDLSPAKHNLVGFGDFLSSHPSDGLKFTAQDLYKTPVLDKPIQTFEAWVSYPTTMADSARGGVILGNYNTNTAEDCITFEIYTNGRIRAYMRRNKAVTDVVFSAGSDIRRGTMTHVAVSFDYEANKAYCYIDGELVSTVDKAIPKIVCTNPYVLGGDLRSGNSSFCTGSVASVAAYSDLRTAAEIKEDMTKYGTEDLIFLYNPNDYGMERLADRSGNGNHLTYTNTADASKNETYVEGMTFNEDPYTSENALTALPKTFEARVFFRKDENNRGGVIIGNYTGSDCAVNLEIYSNGRPRLYFVKNDKTVYDIVLETSLYNGEWNDLAVVIDEDAKLFRCYVNGVEKTTRAFPAGFSPELPTNPIVLGGDLRSGNPQYFKGRMESAAIYADVRTPDEIRADREGPDLNDANLIAAYDSSCQSGNVITDKLGNYNLKRSPSWIDPKDKAPVENYDYSIAIIGDIQIMTEKYPDKLPMIYDWLLENKDGKKISYVMGMGDNTNSNTDTEWALVKQQWFRLNGEIPFLVNRGNHDSSAQFNKYLNDEKYTCTFDGTYNEKAENTYRFFEIEGQKYLLFTLDYGMSDAVMNWAGSIIEKYPDYQVILTTHAYLFRDGTTLDQGDVCPPATNAGYNNGDAMWDKFVSKYDNILMMICGHDPCDDVIVTKTPGIHGNVVTQMLVDPQGMDVAKPNGMICMLYFSADGKVVDVEYYSAVRDQFFREKNQFTMEVGEHLPPVEYTITEGSGAEWTKGSEEGLAFSLDGGLIEKVLAGETELPFTLTDNGFLLSAKVLEDLDADEYDLTVILADGTAEGTFTVVEPEPIETEPEETEPEETEPEETEPEETEPEETEPEETEPEETEPETEPVIPTPTGDFLFSAIAAAVIALCGAGWFLFRKKH